MAQARNVLAMPLRTLLTEAFQAGSQPSRNKTNLGIFITDLRGRKHNLVDSSGRVAPAGKIWYEDLNQVDVPKLYRYEQPLIDDILSRRGMARTSQSGKGTRMAR